MIEEWKVKVYTISKEGGFTHYTFYENVKRALPNWLEMKNKFDSSNDKIGFLILHSGTEGYFSLINWWVGKNMLNTHIFITDPSRPEKFDLISGDGLSPCIWELAVINHERVSWTHNVVKRLSDPQYSAYLQDTIDAEL